MTYVYIAIGIIVLWFIYLFNHFVTLRNRATEAWADIEVQLKRRYDLIPNLVNTVKGYVAHEKGVFENVTKARAEALSGAGQGASQSRAQAENQLTGALKSLFAVAEAYPNLKASDDFINLQRELSDTENKIQAARRFYNGNVRDFNTGIQKFPGNVVAGIFGFKQKEFFDLPDNDAAQNPVEVKF